MTSDHLSRNPNLFYEDDQETDDIPGITPYHSTLDGRCGTTTLPLEAKEQELEIPWIELRRTG